MTEHCNLAHSETIFKLHLKELCQKTTNISFTIAFSRNVYKSLKNSENQHTALGWPKSRDLHLDDDVPWMETDCFMLVRYAFDHARVVPLVHSLVCSLQRKTAWSSTSQAAHLSTCTRRAHFLLSFYHWLDGGLFLYCGVSSPTGDSPASQVRHVCVQSTCHNTFYRLRN